MKIPLFKTYSDQHDIDAVSEVIRRGTYWAIGPEIEQFEKKIADFIEVKYALAFNSGTSALHALLLAHNIKGKEVIVPSFTFIATANAVVLAGGIPVFAEVEPETFSLEAEDVEKKITEKTAAILPMHYGGFVSRDIEKLRKIADKHNLLLIEDAAESLGSEKNMKLAGTFGHSAIFSFCQNKVISTGEGGMAVTESKEIFEKCRLYRSHGRVELPENYFDSSADNDYTLAGYNYRMPTMNAALGISQFAKISSMISARREIAEKYTKAFSEIKQIKTMQEKDCISVYQMYTITLDSRKIRDSLQSFLKENSIASKIYFFPVHQKTVYQHTNAENLSLSITEEISKKVLSIPVYPSLKEEETDFIIQKISEFFRKR